MYGVSPDAYLSRARASLAETAPAAVFYAAYELRCCIEARQAEYLAALEQYRGTRIKPWNIGDNGKRIRRGSYADSLVMVRYWFEDGPEATTYHTPVGDKLLQFAERTLGALLHVQPEFRSELDPWWASTRASLLEGYRMAWLACQGDSLVPPLWNLETKALHPVPLEKHDRNAEFFNAERELIGAKVLMEVRYPEVPPQDWVYDL